MTTIEEKILNYNFSPEDIKCMKEVEHVQHADLHELFEVLSEHCVSRDSVLWQKYHIEDMVRKKVDMLHGKGSRQAQFCRHCGQTIWFNIGDTGKTE
jgi:hypothetical protein